MCRPAVCFSSAQDKVIARFGARGQACCLTAALINSSTLWHDFRPAGQWCRCSLLPQGSTVPSVCLTTPHHKHVGDAAWLDHLFLIIGRDTKVVF